MRKGGASAVEAAAPERRARLAARAQAERLWPVSADRPLLNRPGARGALARPVKQVLRKLLRWYVEPLALDQKGFNDAVLKLVDDLSETVDHALGQGQSAARLVRELEERLSRLERRERTGAVPTPAGASAQAAAPPSSGSPTVAAQAAASAIPDYFAYESRMRGAIGEIRERQRPYLADFAAAPGPVVDLGCGRGEFLGLLRDAGIAARGVDGDADMVAFAAGEGLAVEQADVVAWLGGQPDASLGGIFMAQVVEHLPPPVLVHLLELAVAKLAPGGLLVAETINPLSPLALRSYFADLTHAQPLVPETLVLLAQQAGFREVETRFLNPPAERLAEPADPLLAENARRLNELLFGPLDYAIVARA